MSSVAGERGEPPPTRPDRLATTSRVVVAAAYIVLGATLLWSRLYGLGHSFWNDEILMVQEYVRRGAVHILTSPSINHELMALLSWALSSVVGESEVTLRLLSAVPFVAGVALVTAWLHSRIGALSGVLFLFLATVSPLLLDITRQARGYGIAFLAMSVVVVGALEALRVRPNRGCHRDVRWRGARRVDASPDVDRVRRDRRRAPARSPDAHLVRGRTDRLGRRDRRLVRTPTPAPSKIRHESRTASRSASRGSLTAPIDQVFLPALLWIDGTALVADPIGCRSSCSWRPSPPQARCSETGARRSSSPWVPSSPLRSSGLRPPTSSRDT